MGDSVQNLPFPFLCNVSCFKSSWILAEHNTKEIKNTVAKAVDHIVPAILLNPEN